MKLIIAGGTGFVGSTTVRLMLEAGHEITILKRPSSKAQVSFENVNVVYTDQERPIISRDIRGDAIINLAGIIREYPRRGVTFRGSHFLVTKNLVDFARDRGIRRFLLMSASGVGPEASTEYYRTKFEAERYLRESGLDWTIFRPSVLYGPGGELISLLAKMIKRLPAVPIIGSGEYIMQPIHIDDTIMGFRGALENAEAIGRVFCFGGPEIISYSRMIDIIGEVLGKKRVRKIHQSVRLLRLMAKLFDRFEWFPLSNDQITMLIENDYTEDSEFFEMFGIKPRKFRDGLKGFLK